MLKRVYILSCLMLCAFLVLFFTAGISASGSFEIQRIGNIHPYADNIFRIHSDESGQLTIRIHDNICTYRTLSQRIEAGETDVHWDGCSYHQEKLYEKYYTVTAELRADSGSFHSASFNSPIDYSFQFLLYALPSSDCVFLDTADDWFLEYRTVSTGTIRMVLTADGDESESFVYSFQSTGGKILRKSFESISGKNKPSSGLYTVSVFEVSRPKEKHVFRLSVSVNKPAPENVSVTGEIMPDRSMSETEIWEMMMRPSVVVNIDYFRHQAVYSSPDPGAVSLGTLHGQTQGVKVIRTENDWALIGAWNHEEAAYIEGWVPLSGLKVEYPQKEYGLLIDKKKQTMSVFYKGRIIDTLLVSTGRAEKNRLYQETAAGCFLTGYHRVNFSMNGKRYDYVIQYDGGNLLHQTPYNWGQNKKDFTYGRGYLGAKASHACIRIQAEPGNGGLNAYWLFTHLPYHTRVIVLDDPEEREASARMLQRTEKSEMESGFLNRENIITADHGQTVAITFGGCLIPGGTSAFNTRKESFVSLVNTYGYGLPLEKIKTYFEKDDYTCINLSGLIFNSTNDSAAENKKVSGAPEGMEEILRGASVELVQMTQDSIYDAGVECVRNTASCIEACAGTLMRGQSVIVMIKDHLFGFAGCSESEYLADPGIIDTLINDLIRRGCEKIIFLASWGNERQQAHTIVQEAMAHRCVRAGANLVVGNRQGVVQGIEYIEGVPVIYSLGNLLDGSTSSKPKKQQGMLMRASFCFGDGTDSVSVVLIPILPYGKSDENRNDFRPTDELSSEEVTQAMKTIWQDTTDSAMRKTVFSTPDHS